MDYLKRNLEIKASIDPDRFVVGETLGKSVFDSSRPDPERWLKTIVRNIGTSEHGFDYYLALRENSNLGTNNFPNHLAFLSDITGRFPHLEHFFSPFYLLVLSADGSKAGILMKDISQNKKFDVKEAFDSSKLPDELLNLSAYQRYLESSVFFVIEDDKEPRIEFADLDGIWGAYSKIYGFPKLDSNTNIDDHTITLPEGFPTYQFQR